MKLGSFYKYRDWSGSWRQKTFIYMGIDTINRPDGITINNIVMFCLGEGKVVFDQTCYHRFVEVELEESE